MSEGDFNAVKTSFFNIAGGFGKVLDNLVNIFRFHHLGYFSKLNI